MLSEDRIHLHVYGLRNCDSCRAIVKVLDTRNVPHTFHDLRKDGLAREELAGWLASSHREYLVNRRSATWRQLTDEEKQSAADDPLETLLEHPTLIKRPVITDGRTVLDVGFSPENLEDYI